MLLSFQHFRSLFFTRCGRTSSLQLTGEPGTQSLSSPAPPPPASARGRSFQSPTRIPSTSTASSPTWTTRAAGAFRARGTQHMPASMKPRRRKNNSNLCRSFLGIYFAYHRYIYVFVSILLGFTNTS